MNHTSLENSISRSREIFSSQNNSRINFEEDELPLSFEEMDSIPGHNPKVTAIKNKMRCEYLDMMYLPRGLVEKSEAIRASDSLRNNSDKKFVYLTGTMEAEVDSKALALSNNVQKGMIMRKTLDNAPSLKFNDGQRVQIPSAQSLIQMQTLRKPAPKKHSPWKLKRVISGHVGWVRSIATDPSNEWFATGSTDRMIKIWDLASGDLKLSLTGHVSSIRALVVSPRHPYLFSAGEDKQVKCWDLETNKVIRHYHGHLSGIYCMDIHPTLDVLVTGGRDSVARVWDMRSKQQIHILKGHQNTVGSVFSQETDPQIVTGSMDSTIRLWDLAAGKTMTTLTHHKKSIRCFAKHHSEFTFASGASDNIKQWKCPEGIFLQNLSGHNALINTLSINQDNVLFSGADNGTMCFWDWKSGHCFQKIETTVQPGSMDNEAGIFCSTFDRSGTRLLTGEADKTIKIWKEIDEDEDDQ